MKPWLDPESTQYPDRVFRWGQWRTQEQVERQLNKHHPTSTDEKRAMLEAAGEEWPIGSDGLPMCWYKHGASRGGGYWRLRSLVRADGVKRGQTDKGQAAQKKKNHTPQARAARAAYRDSHIQVSVAGVVSIYPVPPERKAELQERLADFRAQQRQAKMD